MVFHWIPSDRKSPQVSRTLLSIQSDLNNAVVWMVSTRPLLSQSSSPCTNHSVIVPSVLFTTGITVIFMFHRFFSFLTFIFHRLFSSLIIIIIIIIILCLVFIVLQSRFSSSIDWLVRSNVTQDNIISCDSRLSVNVLFASLSFLGIFHFI